ncbi:MAG: pyridoxamine 5'-phosphate oxidase family protein [Myxococcota bacterium]
MTKRTDPIRSRPGPAGYFAEEPAGMLPWSHVVDELRVARNYWIATVGPDGMPHAMPVWAVWQEDQLLFSTSPASAKARNLRANPRTCVHLESGQRLVVLQGETRPVGEPRLQELYRVHYNPKYDWDFTPEQLREGVYAFRPQRAFAWLDDHGDGFAKAATRFTSEYEPSPP